ncbi:MAG TPA: hypothetical protein VJA66_16860 [Thermoanaerobaculia bacterium]
MKKTFIAIALAAVVAFPACTNKQGETEAPVYITVNIQLQPGFVDVGTPAPVQIQTMVLDSHLKNATASDPQGFATTIVEGYNVHFRRTDGGTKVPPDQTFGAGVTVSAGGTATLSNFPVLPISAIQASPFDQLLPFNGGVDRETGKTEIQMAFDITFFGHTVAGQRVLSETASGLLLFVDSAVTPLSRHSKR